MSHSWESDFLIRIYALHPELYQCEAYVFLLFSRVQLSLTCIVVTLYTGTILSDPELYQCEAHAIYRQTIDLY